MTESETQKFGNRCPEGFFKESLLGKGGYAIVWKIRNNDTNEIFAAKQFPKNGRKFDESSDNEIQIHKIFKEFEQK